MCCASIVECSSKSFCFLFCFGVGNPFARGWNQCGIKATIQRQSTQDKYKKKLLQRQSSHHHTRNTQYHMTSPSLLRKKGYSCRCNYPVLCSRSVSCVCEVYMYICDGALPCAPPILALASASALLMALSISIAESSRSVTSTSNVSKNPSNAFTT